MNRFRGISCGVALATACCVLAQEPELRRTLVGHEKEVRCLAFSRDGLALVSGSVDKTVRVWDIPSGRNTSTLNDTGVIRSVAFAPDGNALVSSSSMGRIKIWNSLTGRNTATLKTHNLGSYFWVSPDGKSLLWTDKTVLGPDSKSTTWAESGHITVKRWHIEDGTNDTVCELVGGFDTVFSCAFTPKGRMLAIGDSEGRIELWSISACGKTASFVGHRSGTWSNRAWLHGVLCLAFSPNGKTLASGGSDKVVKLWDVTTGKQTAAFRGHKEVVLSVAFGPDGRALASCGYESTIRLWDTINGKCVANMDSGSEAVCCVVFSPDGKTLASAGHGNTIKLWNVASREVSK
jgi:WD40 repeat protein